MTGSDGDTADVVEAILGYLRVRHADDRGVERLLDRYAAVEPPVVSVGARPRHERDLDQVVGHLATARDDLLAAVGHAVHRAARSLAWRVDDGGYYAGEAPISESYRDGNMHAVLAEGPDFAMGLFLLTPEVDYLDHRHQAPELYLNLTGPTQWRFDHGEWQELRAGSVLWNEPGRVHATRTGAAPWLSFWAWLSDTNHPCEVVVPAR